MLLSLSVVLLLPSTSLEVIVPCTLLGLGVGVLLISLSHAQSSPKY